MNLSHRIISNVEKVLLGKPEAVELAVACFLSEGHLLIDDIPGVGKTTLALALARSIGCSFQRIQFTSDLLPSDVLGVSVFNQKTGAFEFKPGPIFHNVVLADEINRASPKTQSALLEAMQEGQVSIDNQTHILPRPFFVIATQNPHEHHGTYPLPESQLDRFLLRLNLGYPSEDIERRILKGDSFEPRINQIDAIGDPVEVTRELERIRKVAVDESLDAYIVEVARMTRSALNIELGLSPRGTLALRRAAQAFAAIHERTFVTPDDIKAVLIPVMAHRIRLKSGALNGNGAHAAATFIEELARKIPVPR